MAESYAQAPYSPTVFKTSLPENSYLAAMLYGVKAAKPSSAKVLELGCGTGGNIIPFAINHPEAKVVGIDISEINIKKANKIKKALKLKNIEFIQKDILDIDRGFVDFDYIIAHSLYSYVSDDTKYAIIRIFNNCLSKNGIAYVSFNTYPGWKGKEILGDVMKFLSHEDRASKEYFVDTLNYLGTNSQDSIVKKIVEEQLDIITNEPTKYIENEFFTSSNKPDYFYQVADMAKVFELSYLCDANFNTSIFHGMSEEFAADLMARVNGDRVKFEQFCDLMVNRSFRRALFVRDELARDINTGIDIKFEMIDKLFVSGKFLYDENLEHFINLENSSLAPSNISPIVDKLNETYPSNIQISELMSGIDESRAEIYQSLAYLICAKHIRVMLYKREFLKQMPKKLKLRSTNFKLINFIKDGDISFFNQNYDMLSLNEGVDYEFLNMLDGTKEEIELVDELASKFKSKESAQIFVTNSLNKLFALGLLV